MSLPGNISNLARLPSASSQGYGDVDGPASSTDSAVALFNGTTGKIIKNSPTTITGSTSATMTLGAAGSGTIVAGTGNSRTLTLQGTSSGGTATTFLVGSDTAIACPSTLTSGLQLYNTADQTTNYERLNAYWAGNIAYLGFTYAGSADARVLNIGVGSVNIANPVTRNVKIQNAFPLFDFDLGATSTLTTQGNWMRLYGTNTATTGTGAVLAITPTYNQASGTAANTDLLVNRTQTAVGSGAQLLADFQVGGVSRFNVSNIGAVTVPTTSTSLVAFTATTSGSSGFIQNNITADSAGTPTTAIIGSLGAGGVYMGSGTSDAVELRVNNSTAVTLGTSLQATFAGALITTPQALSGAGAVNVTTSATFYTSTGGAQALTLADGTAEGQIKTIVHKVDGGSGVLTPTTKIGFTTITFTNVGDSCTLQWTSAGWAIVGIYGAVAA